MSLSFNQTCLNERLQPNYTHTHTHIYIYIYIYIYYQPPTRGDNSVSLAQDSTATPSATKQLLPPDRVLKEYIYIYIYIYVCVCVCVNIYTPDQLRAETTLDVHLHSLRAVCDLKKRVYFRPLMLLQ